MMLGVEGFHPFIPESADGTQRLRRTQAFGSSDGSCVAPSQPGEEMVFQPQEVCVLRLWLRSDL